MKRNQITTVSELKPGDRFYKQNCRAKTPIELLEPSEKFGKFNVCDVTAVGLNGFPRKTAIREMKGSTVVVFLRNVNEK